MNTIDNMHISLSTQELVEMQRLNKINELANYEVIVLNLNYDNNGNVIDIPDVFLEFVNVKVLHIEYWKESSEEIENCEVTPTILKCSNVEQIYFGSGVVLTSDACDKISKLKRLTSLYFYNCKIEGIITFDELESLEDVAFSHNTDVTFYEENLQNVFKSQSIKKLEIGVVVQEENKITFNKNILKNINNMKNLESLYISGAGVNELIEDVFIIDNLKYLHIECFELNRLPKDILKAKKLETLKISTNALSESVMQLNWLKKLRIYGEFDDETLNILKGINGLLSLEELSITGVENLPDEICELKNLGKFDCMFDLKSIPKNFGNLKSLKELDITGCELNEEDFDVLGQLEQLEVLICNHMCDREIYEFPSFIRNLKNLKILDLSDLNFKTIPSWITELKNLEAINLNWTTIEEIPDFFVELTNLKELYISYTPKLKKITSNISKMSCLKILSKQSINLSEIADTIVGCTSLEYLDFAGYELSEFPDFSKMNNLKELKITGNYFDDSEEIDIPNRLKNIKLPVSLEALMIEEKLTEFLTKEFKEKVTLEYWREKPFHVNKDL